MKRLKLPNGFGQITKLKNKRLRNSYRAMITIGKTEEGKPICKLLKPVSYFKTYNEAYKALVEYHSKPQTLQTTMTLSELYDKWFEEKCKEGITDSRIRTIRSAWNNIKVGEYKLGETKAYQLKEALVNADCSANIKSTAKNVLCMMYDYAIEYEYVDRNYAREIRLPKNIITEASTVDKKHVSFSAEEISKLWQSVDKISNVDLILIQCYSGWRPGELVALELKNINIEELTFTGGMKTENGINRTVPIHSKIRELVKKRYEQAVRTGSKYLVNFRYDTYRKHFEAAVKASGISASHRPHDPRKYFATTAKAKGVDEYAVKRIMGHSITDLTEKVYTERSVEWLRQEIEKI